MLSVSSATALTESTTEGSDMCDEEKVGTTLGDLLRAAQASSVEEELSKERMRVLRLALASLVVENSHVVRDLRASNDNTGANEQMARAIDAESMVASDLLSGRFVLIRK